MDKRREDLLEIFGTVMDIITEFGFEVAIDEFGKLEIVCQETGEIFYDIETLFKEAINPMPKGMFIC